MNSLNRLVSGLKEIMDAKAFFLARDNHIDDVIELIEDGENNLRKVSLSGVPENALVVKIDRFELRGGFLQEGNINCRCDYLIIDPQKDLITLVELKLGRGSTPIESIANQYRGGLAVVDYLLSVIDYFNSETIEIKAKQWRFLLITYRAKGRKRSSNPGSGRSVTEPRQIHGADKANVEYGKLVK